MIENEEKQPKSLAYPVEGQIRGVLPVKLSKLRTMHPERFPNIIDITFMKNFNEGSSAEQLRKESEVSLKAMYGAPPLNPEKSKLRNKLVEKKLLFTSLKDEHKDYLNSSKCSKTVVPLKIESPKSDEVEEEPIDRTICWEVTPPGAYPSQKLRTKVTPAKFPTNVDVNKLQESRLIVANVQKAQRDRKDHQKKSQENGRENSVKKLKTTPKHVSNTTIQQLYPQSSSKSDSKVFIIIVDILQKIYIFQSSSSASSKTPGIPKRKEKDTTKLTPKKLSKKSNSKCVRQKSDILVVRSER